MAAMVPEAPGICRQPPPGPPRPAVDEGAAVEDVEEAAEEDPQAARAAAAAPTTDRAMIRRMRAEPTERAALRGVAPVR